MNNLPCFTDYAINLLNDFLYRQQALTPPATLHASLHAIQGAWAATTVYSLGQCVVPSTTNGRLYKCTTAGTSGGAEPAWPTTSGTTVTDGTVVWTEQTTDMNAGTFPPEISAAGYSRVAIASSLASWSGTQGAGTTAVSTGGSGVVSNNNVLTWPAVTADWTPGGAAGLLVLWDAASGGNPWNYVVMSSPQVILNGSIAPTAAAAALSLGFGR